MYNYKYYTDIKCLKHTDFHIFIFVIKYKKIVHASEALAQNMT